MAGTSLGVAAPPASTRPKPVLRGWMHLGALATFVVAGPALAERGHGPLQLAALSLYALSLVLLFGVSAAFHRFAWSPPAARRMRRADHATIFFAIAGTYSAVAVSVLGGWARILLLSLVWAGAVAGVVLRQVWLDAPKWAVAVPYVGVGWAGLPVLVELERGLGGVGFGLLLGGGISYSIGALVYARRRPDPLPNVFGFHEIFHSLTVAGASLQYAAISLYGLRGH